jgi:hypothetical protein
MVSLKRAARALVLVILSPAWALAQAPAPAAITPESVLRPGQTAWITTAGGEEQKTRIVAAADGLITLRAGDGIRRLTAAEIRRVRVRQGDSLVNGAVIGAAVAVASGLFLCTRTEPWRNCRDDAGPMLRIGAIGAGAGIALDALIRGRRTVYEAPGPNAQMRVWPVLTADGGGVRWVVEF